VQKVFGNNYRYSLTDMHAELNGAAGQVLFRNSSIGLNEPATVEISFYNDLWRLSAIPSAGWSGHAPPLGWGILAALSLLVASFAILTLERKRLAATDALHDPLTGLPNRTLLAERGEMALAQARRNGRHAAVMFLDLDGFKPINDQWGHVIGDSVLHRIGHRLTHALRDVDVVGRVGGDEFVVVLSNLTEVQYATAVAQKLIATVTEPLEVDSTPVQLGVSIGVSLYPEDGNTFHELLDRADRAMYRAKRAGGDQYQLVDSPSERQPAHTQKRLYPAP
jgi:diguanylate cyclase (GGDEF)-like protein